MESNPVPVPDPDDDDKLLSPSIGSLSLTAALAEWNPMGDDSASQSTVCSIIPSSCLELNETSCPFQKEPYKPCYKGPHRCQYKHGKYTPQMVAGK